MNRERAAGRIVAAVAVLVAVAAVVAVLALSGGNSVPSPGPTVAPSLEPSASALTTPSDGVTQPDVTATTVDALTPSESLAASWTQTTQAASGPEVMSASEAPPPGAATEALDPDASAKAELSAADTLPSGQLALEDLPSTVGLWSADDELGPVAYTKAGGSLEDTITVTSLGADSMGLDHWRSSMTDATAVDGGLCGLVGGVAACVLPSQRYGEVMLFGTDGVGVADVREVATGVSSAVNS